MKRFFKNHPFLIIASFCVATAIVLAPSLTHAAWYDFLLPTNWIPMLMYIVVFGMFKIAGTLFGVVGWFLDAAVALNYGIIHSQIALTGWLVVRNLANLAIVIAVIFIAIATIIGREEYRISTLLGKLVVMALLINFTFVISGLFIDASSVFTTFFLSNIVGDDYTAGLAEQASNDRGIGALSDAVGKARAGSKVQLSDALATMLQVSGFLAPLGVGVAALTPESIAGSELQQIIGHTVDLSFVTIFLLVATVIVGNIAVLYAIRYFALITLLILAPLAWILYAFPKLEGYTTRWWKTFLEWVFFLPASMFFIYLAVLSILNFTSAGTPTTLAEKFTHLAFGFGFLFTAMLAGKFVGGSSAEIGLDVAARAKGFVTGTIAGGAGAVGGFALSRYLNGPVKDANGKNMTRAESWKLALAKRGFVGAANIVGGMAGTYGAKADEYKEKYAGLNKAELAAAMNASANDPLTRNEELLAMSRRATELHAWGNVDDDKKQKFVEAARSSKDRHDVLAENPQLITDAAEAKEIAEHMTSSQVAKLHESSFNMNTQGGKAVVGSLEKIDLDALYREGNKKGLEAALHGIGQRIEHLKSSNWGDDETGEARRINAILDSVRETPGHQLRQYLQPAQYETPVEAPAVSAARQARKQAAADETARSAAEATRNAEAAQAAATAAAAASAAAARRDAEAAEQRAEEDREIGKD